MREFVSTQISSSVRTRKESIMEAIKVGIALYIVIMISWSVKLCICRSDFHISYSKIAAMEEAYFNWLIPILIPTTIVGGTIFLILHEILGEKCAGLLSVAIVVFLWIYTLYWIFFFWPYPWAVRGPRDSFLLKTVGNENIHSDYGTKIFVPYENIYPKTSLFPLTKLPISIDFFPSSFTFKISRTSPSLQTIP